MLEKTANNDQLQFLQNGLAEEFQKFGKFLDKRINALTTKPEEVSTKIDSAIVTSALSDQVAQLIAEIDRASQTISQRQPELADTAVRDFQFLLAAWADESMIKMLGQERLPMTQHGSIERGMFGTVNAGDEFFNKITRMLERRNMDDICLAAAYWLALMQGFEGRYIGGAGATELRRYARALQAIATQKNVLIETPKLGAAGIVESSVPLFIRIGLFVRPKIMFIFSISLLLMCLITLNVHWGSSTTQLSQDIKTFSDLRQASTDQRGQK